MQKIVIALFVAALSNCMSWAAEPGTKTPKAVFNALIDVFKDYKEHYSNLEYAFRNDTTAEGLRKHRVYRDKEEYYDGMVQWGIPCLIHGGIGFADRVLQAPKEGKAETATLQYAHERLKSDLAKAHQRIKELEAALAEKTGIPMAPAIPVGRKPQSE